MDGGWVNGAREVCGWKDCVVEGLAASTRQHTLTTIIIRRGVYRSRGTALAARILTSLSRYVGVAVREGGEGVGRETDFFDASGRLKRNRSVARFFGYMIGKLAWARLSERAH